MLLSEMFLSEKKYPLPNGRIVDVVSNPTPRRVLSMIADCGEVRGAIVDDQLLVWDARKATHHMMINTMNWKIEARLVFFETTDDLESYCDWGFGAVYEFDGYVFITEHVVTPGDLYPFQATRGAIKIGGFTGDSSDIGRRIRFNPNYQSRLVSNW